LDPAAESRNSLGLIELVTMVIASAFVPTPITRQLFQPAPPE
jgi:hypothetical protein